MTTIKDIAVEANVSPSTVSIILSGNSSRRKISKETCQRVIAAAKHLNYQPNVAARRLKKFQKTRFVVGLFWSNDVSCTLLGQAISGIQEELNRAPDRYELIIYPYESGKLSSVENLTVPGNVNAAIVYTGDPKDIDFLDEYESLIPIVVLGCTANRCTSVTSNSWQVGRDFASVISAKGYTRIALLCQRTNTGEISRRRQYLIEEFRKKQIEISEEDILWVEKNSIQSAYQVISKWLEQKQDPLPPVLFCDTDILALGAINVLREHMIQVPADMEILASSAEGQDYSKYCVPSLSIAEIPITEMASTAIHLISEFLEGHLTKNVNVTCDVPIVYRDSFSPCGAETDHASEL